MQWRRSRRSRRPRLGGEADRATFRTLHTAGLAAPALREGLTSASATRASRHLRALLGVPALALTDDRAVLAWDGADDHHRDHAARLAQQVATTGRTSAAGPDDLDCGRAGCRARHAIVSPLLVDGRIVGTLQAYADQTSGGLVRATDEVTRWVAGQLELAELTSSRTRLAEAELRALRAQISPHFVYNSLTTIASFVRTDPDRARDLLLEFADFTRYSFRRHGDYTTLAEELKSVERYLLLEQARFGSRLEVTLQIAPEVLPVVVPYLCVQPLVENAVKHGLARTDGTGRISIVARDLDQVCVLEVEDNGAGEDPERVRRVLAGDLDQDSVGLGNVDQRLRTSFGDDHGLVVETAPGAGTKVIVRVPKFAPGVSVG
ncbi:histidine kinase [Nocardioides sp.]|uniref:histidine kinase n=1 Tax=Nocardioides sp. TaxID=35761 RepID=UPI002C28EBBD|nr:histidine kinase [Nocardioides sp.]HSX67184.1 histidine kinase [Nocardioides sp.]